MSIIQKQSPLNLIGKVAIVTSAATPLGAQTCRTLLRHNCLVLGVDDVPIPESERLFSTQGTHFQRLQMRLDEDGAIKQIVEHSEERFWKQGFDFLITFDESEGTRKLRREIGSRIVESGGGVVLNVVESEQLEAGHSTDLSDGAKDGPRTNTVLTRAFANASDDDGHTSLSLPQGAISEVQECFARFSESTAEEFGTGKGNRALGDLLLYLVSSLGEGVSEAVVTADGRWKVL